MLIHYERNIDATLPNDLHLIISSLGSHVINAKVVYERNLSSKIYISMMTLAWIKISKK